ncbi:LysR family transcriptional regulator [Burkholderia sp. 22PA0099]|uniref:LysR family transcriptional regulator n=1 Tax=Burkholderia sp. 22PA0099 TaxID=3237372 RepID=UPI0039C2926C
MPNLDSLRIFVRVAEMASFTRAAESLGIQKGRASNTVRALEAELGARLLHRSTRTVHLTEDGQVFYQRAQDLLADADALQTMFTVRHDTPLRGRLRVDLPTELARTMVVPALPAFIEAHPEVVLELSSTDRRVDLILEGIDCVLRIGGLVDDTLVARRLGSLRMINAASPGYLRRFGTPRSLHELSERGHRMVFYTSTFGHRSALWEYVERGRPATLALPCALSVNSVQTYYAAGVAGIGLIQASRSRLGPFLASGELVEVLPDFRPAPLPVWLVVAHRHNLSRRVRVFMEWLEQVLTPYLDGEDA